MFLLHKIKRAYITQITVPVVVPKDLSLVLEKEKQCFNMTG